MQELEWVCNTALLRHQTGSIQSGQQEARVGSQVRYMEARAGFSRGSLKTRFRESKCLHTPACAPPLALGSRRAYVRVGILKMIGRRYNCRISLTRSLPPPPPPQSPPLLPLPLPPPPGPGSSSLSCWREGDLGMREVGVDAQRRWYSRACWWDVGDWTMSAFVSEPVSAPYSSWSSVLERINDALARALFAAGHDKYYTGWRKICKFHMHVAKLARAISPTPFSQHSAGQPFNTNRGTEEYTQS